MTFNWPLFHLYGCKIDVLIFQAYFFFKKKVTIFPRKRKKNVRDRAHGRVFPVVFFCVKNHFRSTTLSRE